MPDSMTFLHFGPLMIPAGESRALQASTQRTFQPMKLIVPDVPRPWWRRLLTRIPFVRRFVANARTAFAISNIHVGGVAQMSVSSDSPGVPAEMFMPRALDDDALAHPGVLSLDAAAPGTTITIDVVNLSRTPCEFRAAMLGITVIS